MKDFFENVLISSNLGLFRGWDIAFDGNIVPIAIAEVRNNFLWA